MITTATSEMIKNPRTNSGMDYVEIVWDRPKYLPTKYKFSYSCTLMGGEEYLTSQPETVHSTCIRVRVADLHHYSICRLNLLAVYNPASIDPGITVTESTTKLGIHVNVNICVCVCVCVCV